MKFKPLEWHSTGYNDHIKAKVEIKSEVVSLFFMYHIGTGYDNVMTLTLDSSIAGGLKMIKNVNVE